MPDTKSRLPPATRRYMRKLNSEALKLYANDLLSSYSQSAEKHQKVGHRMAQEWVRKQGEYFDCICEELRQIITTGDAPED